MKRALAALALLTVLVPLYAARAQGTINFLNGSSTLVSYYPPPPSPPPPGAFYFALLTAPLGTTDPSLFTFSGNYATNLTTAGIIFGGNGRVVNGWVPGTSRSFRVAGWSADGGHDWNPVWLTGWPGSPPAYFGLSAIGQGFAGGVDPVTGGPIPALNIFGAAPSINTGFILGFPEPSATALCGVGMLSLLRWRKRNRPHKYCVRSSMKHGGV